MKSLDVQHGGSHYKNQGIQPIEYAMANNLGFCEGNVVKYVTRHKDKNGAEDIKKAIHYLEFILEFQYSQEEMPEYKPETSNLLCCEGGKVGAGCYHDHCVGAGVDVSNQNEGVSL